VRQEAFEIGLSGAPTQAHARRENLMVESTWEGCTLPED